MPEVEITIGGRSFDVACQEGEEHFLQSAAAMLDREAKVLTEQIGRLPESRMLLMAGLMLADKAAAMEDDLTAKTRALEEAEAKLTERARQIADLQEAAGPDTVAVIPTEVHDHLAELAARAEALADELEAEPSTED